MGTQIRERGAPRGECVRKPPFEKIPSRETLVMWAPEILPFVYVEHLEQDANEPFRRVPVFAFISRTWPFKVSVGTALAKGHVTVLWIPPTALCGL